MKAKEKFQRIHATELIRRGYDVIFIQVNHQRGFLFGRKGTLNTVPNTFQLSLEEKTKNPVSRQILDIHMGRTPKQYKTNIRTYYATVLDMPKAGAYTAWEVI